MARVIEIVIAHLVAGGFDGLVQTDSECGCLCDDLAPCGGDFGLCEPGYRGMHADEPGEWSIYRSKDAARESVANASSKAPNASLTGAPRQTDRSEPDYQASGRNVSYAALLPE